MAYCSKHPLLCNDGAFNEHHLRKSKKGVATIDMGNIKLSGHDIPAHMFPARGDCRRRQPFVGKWCRGFRAPGGNMVIWLGSGAD